MESLYGPVTAFSVSLAISIITEWLKRSKSLEGRQVQIAALLLSVALSMTYHTLTSLLEMRSAEVTPELLDVFWLLFSGALYSIFAWSSAIGLYEIGAKWSK